MIASWNSLDRWTRSWLTLAALFGGALIVAAFTVSAYSGSTSIVENGATRTTSLSQTLVQANGYKVVWVVAAPLCAALVVVVSILIRRRRRAGVGLFTWIIIVALCLLAFVGLLSVGPFIAPIPICLVVAALRVRDHDVIHTR